MKTIFSRIAFLVFPAMLIFSASTSFGQFTRANIQASGLTCAMCTKAIHNALLDVPFVDSVKADIKNSSFLVTFRKDRAVDLDALQKAVENAGFFVAGFKVTGHFDKLEVNNDSHVKIGGQEFHFVSVKDQVLNGDKELTVVDKNFLSAAAFKKYSAATKMECIKTGLAGSCCQKDGLAAGQRVFHVTI